MSSTDIFDSEVVDLFAGPGGWDVAARRLGFDPMGIEFEHTACETRRAARFPTIEGDVRDYGPANFPALVGLIGSPPCQTFSMAGKGAGRAALDQVLGLLRDMAVGVVPDYSTLSDDRTGLVLDPLRWVLEACALGRPLRWVVLEQVPTVLPVWQAYAEVLRGIGYRVETAVLNAEQYGVPQTRKRAVLVARYNAEVSLPTPTHSRYYSRDRGRLDVGVLPWVSMAQALGWGMTARPYPTIACSRSTGGPDMEKVGGSAARLAIYTEQAAGRWQLATGTRPKAGVRQQDEPSPTLAFGHDAASYIWTPAGMPILDVVAWKLAHGGMRLSLEEAGALQTFGLEHPWQGTSSKKFQQVGNAVPPLLAEAVLSAVLGLPFEFAPVA